MRVSARFERFAVGTGMGALGTTGGVRVLEGLISSSGVCGSPSFFR